MSPEWALRLLLRGPVVEALGKPQDCGVAQVCAAPAAADEAAAAAAEPDGAGDGFALADAVAVPVALPDGLGLGEGAALALKPATGAPLNGSLVRIFAGPP